MADEEGGDLLVDLPAYVEEDDTETAAAKVDRAKRRAEGMWGMDKIREKFLERERIKAEHDKYPVIPARRVDRQVESSFGAMRHLTVTLSGPQLALSANIISVKLVESAIGFPLDVYGTIVVRDELDCKRIYLFRRDQDNCQRISSMDESLSLTGPSRGLVAFKNLYFEIDLKCKNHLTVKKRVLCKWFVKDSALTNTSNVVRNRFVGKICTLDLAYAPAHKAVEVAIKVKIHDVLRTVIDGSIAEDWLPFNRKMKEYSEFHGKVTASINGIPEEVVLYDSKAAGCVIKVGDDGLIELLRCVVSVPIDKMVSFKLVSHDGHCVVDSYPRMCGGLSLLVRVGSLKLNIVLAWSALYRRNVDGVPHCMALQYLY
ncbi:hypothetical protein QOZ80_5BG0415030 [Eleusine coracana subsp. coracana]|nr:hypothetical protein QOZ80_5BG0415030 [Eleusine coracana subsp. coracana]